ncbi:MAG: hypothetical protein EOM32_02005 [Spirochaetia bacterium]|nr:hypothetical protein [Spirochaetia bacterium]
MLVLLLLACELDPPMFSFSYDANGAQSGDLPAPVSLHKGGSTITVAGNTGNLIKPNFSFNSWNTKQDGSGKAYLPGDTFTLAREYVVLYAQWNPNPSYKTTYYRQNADNDDYTLHETENLSGAVNTAAIPVHKIYAGFTENTNHPNTLASGTILADGSLVLKLYYDRNTFTVSFQTNSTATISDLTNQKYGAKLAKPNDPTRQGYTFSGWYKEASLTNPWDFLADTITENTTLYAKWGASNTTSYTVEHYTQDLSLSTYSMAELETLSGPTATVVNATYKTYPGFTKDESNANTKKSGTIEGDGSLVLRLYYTRNTYTVSFQTNSTATISDLTNQPYGATMAKPNDPTRQGYTFSGWYKETELTTAWNFTNDTIQATTTLYAKWAPNTTTPYTVNYYLQDTDGSTYTLQETVAKTGTTASTGTSEAKTYSGFTENTTKSERLTEAAILPDGSLILKRYYDRNTYTLTFDANGGSGTQVTQDLKYQTSTQLTANSYTRAGYSFAGWNTQANGTGTNYGDKASYSIGAGTVILYAQWTPRSYTVTFDEQGGTTPNPTSKTVAYDSTYGDLAATLRSGYTFTGWYTQMSDGTKIENATIVSTETDHTLYAHWTPTSYTITYDLDGGTNAVTNPPSYTIDTPTLTLAEPTKPNYTFDGWYASSAFSGSPVTSILKGSTGAKAFYAKWTPTSYTITYYLDGGANAALNPGSYTIVTPAITLDDPTKTHYDFWGWYETSSFSGTPITTIDTGSSGAKTLYAKWLPTYYLVIFKANGGSSFMDDQSIRYTYQATLNANAFTRTGYSFAGWNTQADGLGTSYADQASITMGNENLTLYTQWTANTYTVSFDTQGGAVPDPTSKDVTFGSSYGILPTTSRTGYTFAGWYTAGSGGDKVESTTTVSTSSNHTLYAQWTAKTYTVTFDAQSGTTPSPLTKFVTYNNTYGTLATTTRSGYTFAGWYTQASGGDKIESTTTVTTSSSHTLYAQWTANTYTVTFDGQGGSAPDPSSKQVTFGSAYGSFATSTLDGYTLAGWYHISIGSSSLFTESSLVALAENHTLLAHWDAITYDITYTLNGGTNSQDNPAHYSIESETITLAAPTRDGYDFVGWYDDVNLTIPQPLIPKGSMGNKTLYVKWTVAIYSVSYELNGGTIAPGKPTAYTILDSTITLLNPTRSHYTFGGWYTTSDFTGSAVTTIPSGSFGDKTFYAKWIPDSYTITYVLNDGTNASANPASYTIETPTISLASPTRLHYDFDGWYAADDFSDSAITTIAIGSTGDITLYAKWTLTNYYVIFNTNGGSGTMASQAIPYNTQANLTVNAFTRTGYSFTGWNTQANGLGTLYPNQALFTIGGANVNLYAQWEKNTYTLTFNSNGGTGTTVTQNLLYATSTPLTANTYTRTGYSFAGWNTQSNGLGTSYADKANYSIGAANAILYANWTPLSISITFDEEGGTTTNPETLYRNYNAYYGELPTTTRTGYTFAGWWTGDNGTGTQVISTTKVTATNWHYLYAKWTPNTNTAYRVEHYQQDVSGSGYTLFETENKTGITATQVTATAKTYANYTYNSNISPASGSIAADGSLVLKLYYDRKTYTVTFQSNGGSAVSSYTGIRYGATISAPADPTRSGYVFNLWYADSNLTQRFDFATQTITANTTLYAKWWSGGVGDLGPAGGVVFHDKGVYSNGWRYLEAASTDVVDAYHKGETTYEWGGKLTYLNHINNTLIGTSLAIGTGEANSLAMIAALSKYSYIYSGADLCREVYRQGGYSDWFLPSILELDLMARLTDGKAGAFTLLSGVYWSSSESSSTNAYLYNSAGKSYSTMPKEYLFQLRAARAF